MIENQNKDCVDKEKSQNNRIDTKKKKKSKNIILRGLMISLVVLGAVAVICLILHYIPGNDYMDLKVYYGVADEDSVILVANDSVQSETAWLEDGVYYLPVNWVNQQVDSRFYSDGKVMLVTDAWHVWTYYAGDTQYLMDGVAQEGNEVNVIMRENQLYVRADWIADEIGCRLTVLENPNRIWVWTKFDTDLSWAKVEKDGRVRYKAGIKSPILERVETGEEVIVRGTLGAWSNVQTQSGLVGYIQTKYLGETVIRQERRDVSVKKIEYPSLNSEQRVIMVWHQTIGTDGLSELQTYAEAGALEEVDVITPSWFTLSDNEGNMEMRGNAEYVKLAHEMGLQVWAMVDNLNIPVDTLAILSDTKVRVKLEEGLVETALDWGVDGINVDLESIKEDMASHFIQFLRELSVMCRNAGLVLSVDDPMPQGWNRYYRLDTQAQIVDYVILMGYDEHWIGGSAGSTASYHFVKDGIEQALQSVPKEKLMNGIPWYTCIWDLENENTYTIGMRNWQEMYQSLEAQQKSESWLEEEQQSYVTFTEDGKQYEVWVEDLQSMAWKMELADTYDLAGVGCWKLGMECDEVWELLRKWK
ncbi:MAG: glycosyl hydrolase family 18 protein [Lachnospiraceae bacterium]